MKLSAAPILADYPYFRDGQFQNENIQPLLVADYLKSAEPGEEDYISISDDFIVQAKLMNWDTDFFGIKMARIEHFFFLRKEGIKKQYDELMQWMAGKQVKHISARLDLKNKTALEFLSGEGFELLTGKLMLRADIRNNNIPVLQMGDWDITKNLAEHSINDVAVIAENNFTENRFLKDSFLPAHKSAELYKQWLMNTISKKNDELYLIAGAEDVAGFSIVSKDFGFPVSGFALINLIAVKNEYKGQGLARNLLNFILCELKKDNFKTAYANVVTSNSASIALFKSCGFFEFAELAEMRKCIL